MFVNIYLIRKGGRTKRGKIGPKVFDLTGQRYGLPSSGHWGGHSESTNSSSFNVTQVPSSARSSFYFEGGGDLNIKLEGFEC